VFAEREAEKVKIGHRDAGLPGTSLEDLEYAGRGKSLCEVWSKNSFSQRDFPCEQSGVAVKNGIACKKLRPIADVNKRQFWPRLQVT
jgi:hypothetical protein